MLQRCGMAHPFTPYLYDADDRRQRVSELLLGSKPTAAFSRSVSGNYNS